MSHYTGIIEQEPIVITPCMVATYGALGAIFAQQLWYWQQKSRKFLDGKVWVYQTTSDWVAQTGLAEQAIRTAREHLKKAGVLYEANYNKTSMDRTLWYSLDIEKVREQTKSCLEFDRDRQEKIKEKRSRYAREEALARVGEFSREAPQPIVNHLQKNSENDKCGSIAIVNNNKSICENQQIDLLKSTEQYLRIHKEHTKNTTPPLSPPPSSVGKTTRRKRLLFSETEVTAAIGELIADTAAISEIATRYGVPESFVLFQADRMLNWCTSKGNCYLDYKRALCNWVSGDAVKIRKGQQDAKSARSTIAVAEL
jgi:hypothetical protein